MSLKLIAFLNIKIDMKYLKKHPFPVEAFFEKSTVLTFAVPKEQLEDLIPKPLELDVFNDTWAFIAIAMVQTRNLRPKGFPTLFGNDFFLIGYRIFVRYRSPEGKRYRGLYIIKSETDKKKMQFLGNMFTRYNYTTTDIDLEVSKTGVTIRSEKSKFHAIMDASHTAISLPEKSPFTNWKEARRFAGPLPYTFTFSESDNTMITIKGVRKNWNPNPIKVKDYNFKFLRDMKFQHIVLASAFEINNIPYYWEKGKVTKWI